MIPRFFIADQHWFCRSLQWFCDGGGSRVNGGDAPEIGDAYVVGLAMALVLFGTALILDHWRTKL